MPLFINNTLRGKGIGNLPIFSIGESGEKILDFNCLIPVPDELDDEKSTNDNIKAAIDAVLYDLGKAGYLNTDYEARIREAELCQSMLCKNMDNLKKVGLNYIANSVKYGAVTREEWCAKYWGIYSEPVTLSIDDDEIIFATPWDIPSGFLKALAEKYPDCHFEYEWEEEFGGSGHAYTDGQGEWHEDESEQESNND